MSQVIFGYLIDPLGATLRRVEIERAGSLKALYALIGCTLVERVQFDEKHDVWVDENGWLNPARAAFEISGMPGRLFAGRGVILAHDDDGESVSPQFSIEHFRERVDAIQSVMSADFEAFNDTLPDGTPIFGERLSKLTTHAMRVSLTVTD